MNFLDSENIEVNHHLEQNLVCPLCKGKLKIIHSSMECESCHSSYQLIGGVPSFVAANLDEHQKAELDSVLSKYHKSERNNEEAPVPITPKWLEGKLDRNTTSIDTRIICLGGGSGDDIPHVKSNFKFNIDHIAHEYIKLSPEMAKDQATLGAIKHIASTTEHMPFKDNYADIVYSRNSLDHVNNPLKTMLEINRVLKPSGKFLLSVYYNSSFIDCCETTSIDDDFITNYLKRLFTVEWMELCPVEEESGHQLAKFALPQNRKIEWLHAVCQKKKDFEPFDPEALEEYGHLTADFHAALYYDELFKHQEASKFYAKVLDKKPLLESDKLRILYSKIRYLSISDHIAFQEFFDQFKQTNTDPFWWKIVILSSAFFMKKRLSQEIKMRFSGEERLFLEHTMKTNAELNLKRSIKNRKTAYKLLKPFYRVAKKFMKNSDVFERTKF